MEQWQRVEGFVGYEVSSEGRVRSYKDYHGHITDDWHILKPIMNHNGYYKVILFDSNRSPHQKLIHRLVAKTFIPSYDVSLVVDHIDGNKANNAVSNLEWVSCKENSIRAINMGLYEPVFAVTRRPVLVTDLRTGEELYFRGVNEAARALGYSAALISRAANMLCDRVGHYAIEFAGREDRLLYGNEYFI